ncbi:selenium cofactor biosynthesis protein YqeC [Curtanaerobium respiraculi]|uniref:selenium cofactor biosynthesis protein YqeC n=1 Tax=Curtanaerobium respiraculi TaxID=2949669 RepID=UPI0024B39C08|nr:selenium cofactor biosynthesis protein YqeC [Curtanaerobium respiraculi]
MSKALYELLGIGKHDLVSVTGAGGKTTMVYLLCDELATTGRNAVVSTTTHMQRPKEFKGAVVVEQNPAAAAVAVRAIGNRRTFAASESAAGCKVKGFDGPGLDLMHAVLDNSTILNEADGAAMRPYKFYRANEPVIPQSTTLIIHVIGCETFGEAMNDTLFHRCPPDKVGRVFDEAEFTEQLRWFRDNKLAPFHCRKVLVVNKIDGGREEAAYCMRDIGHSYFDACLVTSLHERRWES